MFTPEVLNALVLAICMTVALMFLFAAIVYGTGLLILIAGVNVAAVSVITVLSVTGQLWWSGILTPAILIVGLGSAILYGRWKMNKEQRAGQYIKLPI